ncbi:hypothetical protein CDAR_556891 [Caerostris darwini]|uniref:Uncharacterized protein n=1 Tax=Caerostris darwini TaxID=1538125 RepID=A0AAV4QJ27_9ARAC|nr:hypothetical protein CDAR_556891 [Caerostris darwini]
MLQQRTKLQKEQLNNHLEHIIKHKHGAQMAPNRSNQSYDIKIPYSFYLMAFLRTSHGDIFENGLSSGLLFSEHLERLIAAASHHFKIVTTAAGGYNQNRKKSRKKMLQISGRQSFFFHSNRATVTHSMVLCSNCEGKSSEDGPL